MKYIKLFSLIVLCLVYASCTKLDEKFRDRQERSNTGNINPAELLTGAYNSLGGTFMTGNFWHLEEHTSDELLGPTRGPDWDDNGQWRALHAHTWNADHGIVGGAFGDLLSAQFAASNVLQFSPSAQQKAEARFLRALSIFCVLDCWGQVPYRENLDNYKELPTTLKGVDAINFLITELNDIINDLPGTGPAYVANKNAARALLMKVYLNKAAFLNPANPDYGSADAKADMAQVVTIANQITGYTISPAGKYFDNFAPTNDAISTENIFTFFNQNGVRGGNAAGTWFQIAHYNMNPSGWNGFATLSDFYGKFAAGDERLGKSYVYPNALPNPGARRNVGFLVGQQYNLTTDAALQDRKGNPLAFTPQVALRETGNNLEITGIRVMKYPYDYAHSGSQVDNDWVVFRYADVLLMKAEALLRQATPDNAGALAIVNQIRAARGATALGAITVNDILDERGRELYWEGWRRQDLIRFKKFTDPWQEKPTDDPKYILFPIPSNQLAVNPNLTQNPGY